MVKIIVEERSAVKGFFLIVGSNYLSFLLFTFIELVLDVNSTSKFDRLSLFEHPKGNMKF